MNQFNWQSRNQETPTLADSRKRQRFSAIRRNLQFRASRIPSPESRSAGPVSRTPYPVSHFCLLTFAFCLLPCFSSFAAEKPHLITRWENFTTANGMPDAKVFCVATDGNRIWAGTEDGLVMIENGKVAKVYKPADGLAHRVVMSVSVDPETHDLWLATFGGASHLSGGHFENFTT